ncbi:hypothetical protein [Tateyamaria sp.]|uniref:hypothetical protein n=1 Tax=Tateyamaria sp. TaxID=1929288 RepID=UPI00329C8A89
MTHPPERPKDDAWIDQMLGDLAQDPVGEVPEALMARVLADADAMLPAPGGAVAPIPWWRQIVDGIGGWNAVGGLAVAAATGFVIGIGGIEAVHFADFLSVNYDTYYEGQDAVSVFGWDIEEG